MGEGVVLMGEGDDLPRAVVTARVRTTVSFAQSHILRAEQGTETNARSSARPIVLRMATHGFFGEARNERDNPVFRSGLYLSDIEQVQVDRELDDGQLTVYEVNGMELRGTQLRCCRPARPGWAKRS